MDIKLRDMQLVLAVVEEGSLSRAAEKLYTTQPSATRIVAKIESELATPLFDKTDYPWKLTYAGQLFIKKTKIILKTEIEFLKDVHDIINNKKGRFTIGLMPLEEQFLVPPVITNFNAKYPDFSVEFISTLPMNLENSLVSGLVDNALIALPSSSPFIECIPIKVHKLFLALPATHKLAKDYIYPEDGISFPELDLQLLDDFPFILPKPMYFTHNIIIEACLSVGFTPKISLETDFMRAAQSFVSFGHGAAFLFSYFVNNYDNKIAYFKAKDCELSQTIAFAYKKGKKLSLGEQGFLDLFLDEK